ncbi:hypothetical protein LOCC1_G007936 [Lachnellula occidentalis]|uniref:DUF4185 domain-containing protein n=1 Tax=Lachnellula occidentalis TaxID=215460 RepID=A0A8H8U6D4_9HELO|nr:hypothetical protein LOCC1_G007936 [Lachnellula occidentalis]
MRPSACLIIFASSVLAGPVHQRFHKRYDLDHNSVPDWCHTNGDIVSCLLSESSSSYSWTTFIASTSTQAVSTPAPTSVSVTTSAVPIAKIAAATSSSSSASSYPTGTLPDPKTWNSVNGTKWHVSTVGPIYSSTVPSMGWDNGRTSVLSNKPFWIFGDVLSLTGLQNGLSTGPAFYGTPDDILRVDMGSHTNVGNILLAPPAASDPVPQDPYPFWGLSTSNVVEVSPGVGVGFVWEIWRNTSGVGPDRGLGMYRATLSSELPVGNRTGGLVAGPDALPVGIMTVMNAEGYVYTYTNKDGSGIVVGRAAVADAFEADAYEFLTLKGAWVKGIPSYADAKSNYGLMGEGDGGVVTISYGQGSIMWSNYFKQYILFTGSYGSQMMFYASATPYGPFDGPYNIESIMGYGVNVHPFWSPDGSHQTLYVSSGWNNVINMYKLDFDF